jgi:ATP-dependent Clp protease ATP-binding subunit ClpB
MDVEKIETLLRERVLGQENACKSVGRAIQRAELGPPRHDNKPKCSFLFLGPTGVGKTSMVTALLEILYNNEKGNFYRLDMAEFQTKDSIKALLGENRNQQGVLGDAVDKINSNGGGILLFDEIEKAHREVIKILLSVLDEGHVTMSTTEKKLFGSTYLFFTSNLGCSKIAQSYRLPASSIEKVVVGEAQRFFGVELFARFKKHVVFKPLQIEDQIRILKKALNEEIFSWKKAFELQIRIDEESVIPFLMQEISDKRLGARPFINKVEEIIGDALVKFRMESQTKNLLITKENNKLICMPI